jgi:hypothetical protein
MADEQRRVDHMPAHADSPQIPQLEVVCPACKGTGGDRELGAWNYCPECKGARYVPTEEGEKILKLMRHNFRPMLRNTDDD